MRDTANIPNHFSAPAADQSGIKRATLCRVEGATQHVADDALALEEPLEIRLEYGHLPSRVKRSISITMRTPGYDFELAAGFLFTESIVRQGRDIQAIAYCGRDLAKHPRTNVVRVELHPDVNVDMARLSRHFYTSSSCGVCGKSSIEALRTQSHYKIALDRPKFNAGVIHRMPQLLREAQGIFESTGGLHASALFSARGELQVLREDVGRHNALDKVIGRALLDGLLPLSEMFIMVSGRASFELVQKAAMAGLPVLAAVGAPSSLAVELAQESGITLLGFVRNERFNVYSHPARLHSVQEVQNEAAY